MNNLLKLVNQLGRHFKEEFSIRQLAKEAKVPYTTAYRTVSQNKGLFVVNQKGNSKFCSLNLKDNLVKSYLIIAERDQLKDFLGQRPEFNFMRKDLPRGEYALVLFGSRASGQHREKSDIDLCVISRDGKKNINFSQTELLFKVEVNPIFFSKKEFMAMLREEEHNLAKEIIQNHIILYGEDYFWEVVWHAL